MRVPYTKMQGPSCLSIIPGNHFVSANKMVTVRELGLEGVLMCCQTARFDSLQGFTHKSGGRRDLNVRTESPLPSSSLVSYRVRLGQREGLHFLRF